MRLKKLEIYGFKSFAQKTEIVFNQGITGIVGPNGSGKSNIGDAVRWVLGEQSAKTLRGSKMEDVIFNGTQKRKPMAYCEVSLVFENEDHFLPIDYHEVMVTRRVYRNGESEYYINKNASRLRDIVELFRDTGIGKEGYSIIGQGRIDDILSQKSEDRRQVFEEAAGIVKFKSRKEEAERKLNKTLDNLSRVEDIIDELSRQLEPLEKQAKDAKRYLDLSAELKQLDINVFLVRHDQSKNKISQIEQAIEGLEAVIVQGETLVQEKTQAKEELEEKIEQLETEIETIRTTLTEKTNQWYERVNKQERLEQQLERNEEKKKEFITSLEELEEKQQQLSLLEQDGEKGSQLQLLKQQQALDELNAFEEILSQKQQQMELVQAELEKEKTAMMEAINRVSMAKNSQTRQLAVLSQMEQRLEEMVQTHLSSINEMQRGKDQNQKAQQEYQHTLNTFKEKKEKVTLLEEKTKAAEKMLAEQSQNLLQQQQQLQGMHSRLKLLEEMSRDFEGYYQSVKKALTYAQRQNNTKVHGVVAMLMKVPKELETAVDMVLGAALQNIVTEDEYTAKELVQYLRENKLGRATFLPLNTIKGRGLTPNERKALPLPGCIGVASELVSFDPKYGQIIENLLGRTVIAKDLDAGIAIMRAGGQGFRLVTLAGDVMHSGGSITGGSIQSKMTNLLGREREIEELAQNISREETLIQKGQKETAALKEEQLRLSEELGELTYQLHQEEIAVAREHERLENSKEDLRQAENRLEQTDQAKQQLEEGIASIREDLSSLEEQTDDSASTQQAHEEKVNNLQQELTGLREDFEKTKDEVNEKRLVQANISHEWEMIKKDRDRAQLELAQTLRTIENTKHNIVQSEEEKTQLLMQQETLLSENHVKQQELNSLEENNKSKEEHRRENQRKVRELQQEIDELHQQTNDMTGKAHRSEIQKTKVQSELENLQERIWNTYELTYGTAQEMREEDFNVTQGEKRSDTIRTEIRQMGPVNVNAIEDYVSVSERYEDLTTQQKDLLSAREDLNLLIGKLLVQMEEQFVEQFSLLQEYFQETFVRLFGGGKAELKLEDPKDPLNCGIEVIAQPPGKKLQLLSLLSGGERALTAIAILFAMLKLKPTPFCILDEIEAALDDANINYFADYLAEYSKNTQFVVVTHRKGTMERCDALYGVAMEEKGVSKMVSVNLKDYENSNG